MGKASLRQAGAVLRLMDQAEWDSALVQTFEGNWGLLRDLTVALHESRLKPEQLRAVVEGRFEIVESAAEEAPLVVNIVDYVTPLFDYDAVAALVARGRSEQVSKAMVAAWHSLARSLGYNGSVCWQVREGFTLKHHAPKAGPCYHDFQHLKDRNFQDGPTENQIVFWIPRLLENSIGKNVEEQKELLADTRKRFELPNHHLTSYGSVALLSGLILVHFKTMDERVPLNQLWIRTDTCGADGHRLYLGLFGGGGLDCGDWYWDDGRSVLLGCFPLGVEP